MLLTEISFPVYRLSYKEPIKEEGVTFYLSRFKSDDQDITKISIIDDKTVPGTTLARRRLYLKNKGTRLFRIHTSVYFLADLIKLAKSGLWFIDSNGKIFQYIKSRMVDLIYFQIEKTIPIPTGGSIIILKGLEQRFKTLYTVPISIKYAGLLKLDPKSHILYSLSETRLPNTRRKV